MYRIQENSNGSFSVFDSSTGNLAMVIKNENKENGSTTTNDKLTVPDCKVGQLLSVSNSVFVDLRNKLVPAVNLPSIKMCIGTQKLKRRLSSHISERMPHLIPEVDVEDYECIDQDTFMSFFGLTSKKGNSTQPTKLKGHKPNFEVAAVKYSRSDICDVDLCSNLGRFIGSKFPAMHVTAENVVASVTKYEKCCHASSRRLGNWDVGLSVRHASQYSVTYSNKKHWRNHLYTFNRRQRLLQYRRLQTGLTKRSRHLLRGCKNLKVHLMRLSQGDIERIKCDLKSQPTFTSCAELQNGLTTGLKDRSLPVIIGPKNDSDVCIDGTIVIEIDEFGTETITVSPKPSKLINSHTGHPWLSPRPVRNRMYMNSESTANNCSVMLDYVTKDPLKPEDNSISNNMSNKLAFIVSPMLKNGSDNSVLKCNERGNAHYVHSAAQSDSPNMNGCAANSMKKSLDHSDYDSDIEFLGTYSKESVSGSCPLLKKLIKRKPNIGAASNRTHGPPIAMERTSNDSVKIVKVTSCESRSSKQRLLSANRVSATPVGEVKKTLRLSESVVRNSVTDTRKDGLKYSRIAHVGSTEVLIKDKKESEKSVKKNEMDLILRMVSACPLESPDDTNVGHNCIFKCHVCHHEELYKTNTIDSIYCHMSQHGGVSRASLISNLEVFEGRPLVVLQAFPQGRR